MRWYNKMYLGKSIQGKKMYYQYAIQHTKRLTGTYCLMPAACKDDLIDICGATCFVYRSSIRRISWLSDLPAVTGRPVCCRERLCLMF